MSQSLQETLIQLRKLVGEPELEAVLDEVETLLEKDRDIEAEALLQNVEARLAFDAYSAGNAA